jgi:hypothetical protein
MIPGFDVETRHKRLDPASAYLLFTGINSAKFIGRRGIHPDNRVIGEESQHALYVMSIPRSVEVF